MTDVPLLKCGRPAGGDMDAIKCRLRNTVLGEIDLSFCTAPAT